MSEQHLAIRFPLRLERAQLAKEEALDAYARLLLTMAQTPRGSWRANPAFGIRERLEELQAIVARNTENEKQRLQCCQALVADVNAALLQLGLDRYYVERFELNLPTGDTQGKARAQWSSHLFDDLSALFELRPSTLNRTRDQEQ